MTPHVPNGPGDGDGPAPAENPEAVLPDGTRRVVFCGSTLTAAVRDDWWDPGWAADTFGEGVDKPAKIVFEEGDSLPLELAAICYSAFSGKLRCEDGNGTVLSPVETRDRTQFNAGATGG